MVDHNIFEYNNIIELETGSTLPGFQLQYATAGRLNADRSNVVWVCHALTGSADFQDWWPGLFEAGALFDPEDYFIICANTIGGCYGSTGPLSMNAETGNPFFHDFPEFTNRDIVQAFDLLRQHLGIPSIHVLIGGSLGGQHAVEWAIQCSDEIEHLIGVATNAVHSPWGIAFNESQRMAIANDPTWNESNESAGINGMKTARSIALLSYRNYAIYQDTQDDSHEYKVSDYKASSYQQYQGEKLAGRFNAFTYWILGTAMDSHNVGRNRESTEQALGQIKAKSIYIGIRSDLLFPIEEQIFLAANTRRSALDIIDSRYGHDGFLVETDQISRSIKNFYQKSAKVQV
jgi:homoserine O-acetyltransferase